MVILPEISITLADQCSPFTTINQSPEIPVYVTFTRLVVPPRPSDEPSRRTLVQRGLRLGSFRLNCTESVQYRSNPIADLNTTRRAFNWASRASLSAANGPNGGGLTRVSSHRGHSRARSLNSLADLNETLKMNVVPVYLPTRHESRTQSIDLSVLCTSPTAFTSTHNFGSTLCN